MEDIPKSRIKKKKVSSASKSKTQRTITRISLNAPCRHKRWSWEGTQSSRCSSFRMPPVVFPFLQRIKEEWLKLETLVLIPHFESQSFVQNEKENQSSFNSTTITLCSKVQQGLSFSFFPFFSFLSFPFLHPTTTPGSLWTESWYLGRFIRRYSNLNYDLIPQNPEDQESVLILSETHEQGFVIGSVLCVLW